MNKELQKYTIGALILLIAFFASVGCSTVGKIATWADENPEQASFAKSALLTGLVLISNNNPEIEEQEADIRSLIDFALGNADSAQGAVAILERELGKKLDKELRDDLFAIWIEQLRTTQDTDAPAEGPAIRYANEMADELEDAQYDDIYEVGTLYQTPQWAKERWGSNWSDPLWKVTAWFSGVDSYAGFRAWHSYGLKPEEEVQYIERELLLQDDPFALERFQQNNQELLN